LNYKAIDYKLTAKKLSDLNSFERRDS